MSAKGFSLPKIGTAWAFMKDGVEGVLVYSVEQFNEQVLSKVTNIEEIRPYLLDLQAVITCVQTILSNHSSKISESKRVAYEALLKVLSNLAQSLEDGNISKDEFAQLSCDVRAAIDAFKKAK